MEISNIETNQKDSLGRKQGYWISYDRNADVRPSIKLSPRWVIHYVDELLDGRIKRWVDWQEGNVNNIKYIGFYSMHNLDGEMIQFEYVDKLLW